MKRSEASQRVLVDGALPCYTKCHFVGDLRFVTVVDCDNYLTHLSRYIHLKPVKAGIVARAEEFLWSSYRAYIESKVALWWLYCREIADYLALKSVFSIPATVKWIQQNQQANLHFQESLKLCLKELVSMTPCNTQAYFDEAATSIECD